MQTRAQMVAAAVAAKFGEAAALDAKFGNFQKRGLLGKADTKERRQGGAGLWNDLQAALWLDLFAEQERGVPLPLLANHPVFVWLAGSPHVTTRQAQRALQFWVDDARRTSRPTGLRSAHHRARTDQIEWALGPEANRPQRGEFRYLLEQADPRGAHPAPVDQGTVIGHVLAANKAIKHPTDAQTFAARGIALGLDFDGTAWRHRSTLFADRADVKQFWAYNRRVVVGMFPTYVGDLDELRSDAMTQRIFTSPELITHACSYLWGALGGALDAMQHDREVGPFGVPPTIVLSTRSS